MPIIFVTGHGDVSMAVPAMKAGAVEFFTKPCRSDVLLNSLRHAIERSQASMRREAQVRAIQDRYAHLSRKRGHGVGRLRPVEQEGWWRTRHQRYHCKGTSGPGDAKDERRLLCGPDKYGRSITSPN